MYHVDPVAQLILSRRSRKTGICPKVFIAERLSINSSSTFIPAQPVGENGYPISTKKTSSRGDSQEPAVGGLQTSFPFRTQNSTPINRPLFDSKGLSQSQALRNSPLPLPFPVLSLDVMGL